MATVKSAHDITKIMPELIAHATAITRHREHALVNTALMYSLVDLLGGGGRVFNARLYGISALFEGRSGMTLLAWNEGQSVRCEERDCDPDLLPPELFAAIETQTMVVRVQQRRGGRHHFWLPAIYDRVPLACIEIESSRAVSQRQLAGIVAIIGLYTNYLSLLIYSQVDTLTQLLSRKTFDDNLHRILATRGSASRQVDKECRSSTENDKGDDWLAVIDIDHFKQVNDRFGHLFGDEVLILLADTMRKSFRRHDRLFRFGGEEFVIILRHVIEQRAQQVFERFRHNVGQRKFPQAGKVTVSLGYTRIQALDNPTDLIGRADEALYYAKHHGRNQIHNYEALVAQGHLHAQTMNTEVELF